MKVVKKGYEGPRVKDTETFILKALWQHGDYYDYSLVQYKGIGEKVKIICPKHGTFEQNAGGHLQGKGCKSCQYESNASKNSYSKETFIQKAREKHGNKYDYSLVEYQNKEKKVLIICPDHGEFWQRAGSHMSGKGCNACKYVLHSQQTSLGTEEVIRRAMEVHGGTYSYPEQEISNTRDKLHIICKKHGSFYQNAGNHIRFAHGCPKCKAEKHTASRSFDFEVFLDRSKRLHGDKYDYSKVIYKNSNSPVEIICKEHGSFFQTPHSHWDGRQCPKCSQIALTESQRYNKDIFITKSQETHGDRYCYDHVDYVDSVTKVVIGCEEHGSFKMTPSSHWAGQGCPECANLRKGFGRSAIYRSFDEYSNIYLIRLSNDVEDFLKVGLARKPNVRHARIERETDYKIEVLRFHSEKGMSVYDLEKSILQDKELVKYVPEQQFQGYTECFSLESYEIIDELMEVCFDV